MCMVMHPFSSGTHCRLSCFLLLISASFLPDMLLLLLLSPASVSLLYSLFQCISCLLISVLFGVCPCLLVDPRWICRHIIKWAVSPRIVDATQSTRSRFIHISLLFLLSFCAYPSDGGPLLEASLYLFKWFSPSPSAFVFLWRGPLF